MNAIDLKNRSAIVTGGARGIGFAIAKRMLASGATVVLWDVDAAALDAAGAALQGQGNEDGRVHAAVVDVTDAAAIARAVAADLRECGKIDILVNNAGITGGNAPLWELEAEVWRRVVEVNLVAPYLTCRAVVPVMRQNGGGKIVNISSGTPFRGVPFLLHYVTSKGAIVALTRALAKEVGKDNVLVNCVAPGFTMSAGVEAHPEVAEKLRDVSIASRTLQRDQVPEDVVGAVVFLCSEGSSFVTGQTIVIDGGQYFH